MEVVITCAFWFIIIQIVASTTLNSWISSSFLRRTSTIWQLMSLRILNVNKWRHCRGCILQSFEFFIICVPRRILEIISYIKSWSTLLIAYSLFICLLTDRMILFDYFSATFIYRDIDVNTVPSFHWLGHILIWSTLVCSRCWWWRIIAYFWLLRTLSRLLCL